MKITIILSGLMLVGLSIPVAFGFRTADIFIVAAIAAAYIAGRRPGKLSEPERRNYYIIFSFFLSLLLSVIVNSESAQDSYIALRYLLTYISLALLFSLMNQSQIIKSIKFAYFGVAAVSLVGVIAYLILPSVADGFGWVYAGRLGMWFGPNGFGPILSSAIIIGVWFVLYREEPMKTHAPMILLQLAALIATMSFGSMLSLAFGLMALAIVYLRKRRAKNGKILATAAAATVLIVSATTVIDWSRVVDYAPERLQKRILSKVLADYSHKDENFDGDIGSMSLRLSEMADSIELIYDRPIFGYGFGSRDYLGIYTHNLPLLIWLECGALAFIIFAIMIMNFASPLSNHNPENKINGLRDLLILQIILYLLYTLTHPHSYQIHQYYFLIATFAACSRRSLPERREKRIRRRYGGYSAGPDERTV